MTYYVLKSTYKPEEIGECVIKLDQVVGMVGSKITDLEDTTFRLRIDMVSSDSYVGVYNTEEELKNVMKEITGTALEINKLILRVKDVTEKEMFAKKLREMMS